MCRGIPAKWRLSGFQDLQLAGANATARLDGEATPNTLALNADVSLPDLRRADERLTGHGDIVAQLTGTLDQPNATFRANLRDATALGRPISRLELNGAAPSARCCRSCGSSAIRDGCRCAA